MSVQAFAVIAVAVCGVATVLIKTIAAVKIARIAANLELQKLRLVVTVRKELGRD